MVTKGYRNIHATLAWQGVRGPLRLQSSGYVRKWTVQVSAIEHLFERVFFAEWRQSAGATIGSALFIFPHAPTDVMLLDLNFTPGRTQHGL